MVISFICFIIRNKTNKMRDIKNFEKILIEELDKDFSRELKMKERGSVGLEFCGEGVSEQSKNIRIGNSLETAINRFIRFCGYNIIDIKISDNNNHQVDTFFIKEGIGKYFEQKANINLDTEKRRAVIDKIKELASTLKKIFKIKDINYGILHTTLYEKEDADTQRHYNNFTKKGIDVYCMKDLFNILDVDITKQELKDCYRSAGKFVTDKLDKISNPMLNEATL